MGVLHVLLILIRNIVADRAELAAENFALRQRLAILELRSKRPRLHNRDRIFRAWLSQFWPNWRLEPHTRSRDWIVKRAPDS